MRASPQCHDLPLQPAHAVVLKFLHGLYVLVAGTDSRVHLLRILAQHRGARRADRPRSVTLESVSTCHPFCSGPCIRFGNPCIRNDNWQRLCSPLPPVPVPQPAQLSRKSATHSRRRRHRQPHASCAHSTVRTPVLVHRAAWISNRFQLAIRLAPVHAHGSAATRTLNDHAMASTCANHCC